jgi:diguanylate cyclase (GGDEF)-like protein
VDLLKADARNASLTRLGILDSAGSVGLEKLARLAQFVAGCRFAAIHLLDGEHQHRVAAAGDLGLGQTPVTESMCLRVVEAEQPLTVVDATLDTGFEGNPWVTGPDPVRFYSATPLRDDVGVTIGALCVFDDEPMAIDDQRIGLLADVASHIGDHLALHSLVRELGHSATHDALTGLPNRTLLSDRLAQAMAKRRRQRGEPALALIDLDGFKAVNDELGHQAGDQLLVLVAQRLSSAVREADTVARLSGDEFVVLFDELASDDEFASVAARLAGALDAPLSVAGSTLRVRASMGFVRAEPDELGYALLGRADAAMYDAKTNRHQSSSAE